MGLFDDCLVLFSCCFRSSTRGSLYRSRYLQPGTVALDGSSTTVEHLFCRTCVTISFHQRTVSRRRFLYAPDITALQCRGHLSLKVRLPVVSQKGACTPYCTTDKIETVTQGAQSQNQSLVYRERDEGLVGESRLRKGPVTRDGVHERLYNIRSTHLSHLWARCTPLSPCGRIGPRDAL